MRRLLLLLAISFAFFVIPSCAEKIEVVEQTFEDGTPKLKVTYEVDGEVKTKTAATQFYKGGRIEYQGAYNKEGEREGNWFYKYENGNMWSEAVYTNGERNGKSAVYYENGQVRYTGNYKEGKPAGKWTFFDEKGNVVKELNY